MDKGRVQVLGGPKKDKILAELGPGSAFGEIRSANNYFVFIIDPDAHMILT